KRRFRRLGQKMNGLKFTDEAAGRLEKFYRKKDIVTQRLETIRHLNLIDGESVLDIGCGPGFLCENISEIVGPNGEVVGIDISADLVALCNRRNIQHGFRTKLVMPPNSINQMRRLMLSYAHKLPSILPMLIAFCLRLFAFLNRMAEHFFW